jgi:hypothetical protein
MRGSQEQTREGDLGESPGFGWTGRPKADNILLVGWGVTLKVMCLSLAQLVPLPRLLQTNKFSSDHDTR